MTCKECQHELDLSDRAAKKSLQDTSHKTVLRKSRETPTILPRFVGIACRAKHENRFTQTIAVVALSLQTPASSCCSCCRNFRTARALAIFAQFQRTAARQQQAESRGAQRCPASRTSKREAATALQSNGENPLWSCGWDLGMGGWDPLRVSF